MVYTGVATMSVVSVCKNVIAANNKKGWKNPDPSIRVSMTKASAVVARAHEIGITDREGNVVAVLSTTRDGKPIVKCGAKVALFTKYAVTIVEEPGGNHGAALRRQAVVNSATRSSRKRLKTA
jgi:hypothetical protein